MAAFLLKIYHGTGYAPPAATGVFSDVPVSMPLAPWIEEMARLAVTTRLRRQRTSARATPSRAARWRSSSRRPSTAPRPSASSSRPPGDPRTPRSRACSASATSPGSRRSSRGAFARTRPCRSCPTTSPATATSTATATTTRRFPLHTAFFRNAMYQAGPAAPAHAVRPPQDQRRLDEHHHPAEPVRAVHERRCQRERLRELSRHPRGHHAEPGDGRLPQHGTNTKNNPNENYAREVMQLFSIGTVAPQPGRHRRRTTT